MKNISFGVFVVLLIIRSVESGCGCEAWCQKTGKKYGICGDGDTCICSSTPITDPDNGCGCRVWCQNHGHPGGICGDGPTCICSPKTEIEKKNEYVRGKYQLTIINDAGDVFKESMRQSIIETYFEIYPQIHSRFNHDATKEVQVKIDPNYDGIAYASNGQIVISSKHLKEHPITRGVLTHELMHIVQSYPNGQPGWLVEGIADYVRWKYAREKIGSGWELPSFNSNQHYTNSYRITARFLVWLEKKIKRQIINRLDQALRQNQYNNGQVWSQLTGKTVDQLWNGYAKKPNF